MRTATAQRTSAAPDGVAAEPPRSTDVRLAAVDGAHPSLTPPPAASRLPVVDRPQTIMATRSRTATALALLLLGAGGCYQSYTDVDDGDADARIEADGAVDAHGEAAADVEVETDPGVDADADAEMGVCVGGWFDPSSGLCWEQTPSDFVLAWDEAVVYCEDLALGGYGDWRMPTINELRSIIRGCPDTETGGPCGVTDTCLDINDAAGCYNVDCAIACSTMGGPGIDGCYWPPELRGMPNPYYSSSLCLDPTISPHQSWSVSFLEATVDLAPLDWPVGNVRCVRGRP
jgi:hypothetical protein